MSFSKKLKSKYIWFLAPLLLFVVPLLGLPSYLLSFLITLFIFASVAEGLDILTGNIGYFDFGRALYFGLGAYVAAIFQRDMGISPFLSMPISFLLCFVCGFGVIRMARGLRGYTFGITTIALVFFVQYLFVLMPWTGGAEGIVIKRIGADPYTAHIVFFCASLVYLTIVVLVKHLVSNSEVGMAMKAVRGDEDVAESRGINTVHIKSIGYALSVALTGPVGNLYAYYSTYVSPDTVFAFAFSFNVLFMVILGGIGTLQGPLIGALSFLFLTEILRYSIGISFEGLHLIILGILLIAIMRFLPDGIAGGIKRLQKRFSQQ